MRCPVCAEVVEVGAARCSACGEALSWAGGDHAPQPTTTGRPPPPIAYTPKHLNPDILHSRSAAEGERKLVTVMFCDIANSTALAERLGPERMHRVLNAFFGLAVPEIHRHEGTINQFLGDGFMALFGAPRAHEDHARRAAFAAIGLQKKMAAGLSSLQGLLDGPLAVRIGIHTGPVVVGRIGDDLRMDYTAVGDTTNLAARLQQSAEPGTIHMSQSAKDAAEDYIECTPLKPKRLKGIASPVQAYRLLEVKSEAEAVAAGKQRRFGSALVGRSVELARFDERIQELLRGRGSRVAIVGAPGVGKSRLLAEVQRRADAAGVARVEGRCVSNGDALGYWPFLQAIRDLVGIAELERGDSAWNKLEAYVVRLFGEQATEVAPYLGTLLGLPVPPQYQARLRHLDSEAVRRQIFRVLRRLFERVAQHRSLVLVLEDWHWADQTSREVLEHLLPLTDSRPILLCVVTRPDRDLPWPLLAGGSAPETMQLQPLSRADAAVLLQNLLGGDVAPQLRDVLLDRAEGSPLFLEELFRALRDTGALERDPMTGAWHSSHPVEDLPLPGSLHGVIMARVDRLADETKYVLKVSSVIGRTFSRAILRDLVEQDDGALDARLDELVDVELIRRKTGATQEYVFSHALIHEATYGSLLEERRRALHERVARCIESAFADQIDDFLGLLAFHYAQAGSGPKAQEYLFKAGDHAGRIAADVEALRQYNRALASYGQISGATWDPLERAALHRKMGEALFRRGDHQQALDFLRTALASLGTPYPTSRWGVRWCILKELLIQIVHRCSRARWLVDTAKGAALLGEEQGRVFDALGWITYFVDQELFALGVLRHLNCAERRGPPSMRVAPCMAFGVILDQIPLVRLSRWYHLRGMRLAKEVGNPAALAFAHFGLGLHEHHARGDLGEAIANYREAARAYSEVGDFRRWGGSVYFGGWALRLTGRVAESLDAHEELVRAGQDACDHHVWAWGLQGKGRALWQIGRAAEAIPTLEKAIELFASVPDYQAIACASGDLGQCHLRLGDVPAAVAVLERTVAMIEAKRFRGPFCTEARNALAEAYVEQLERAPATERRGALARARAACRAAVKHGKANPEGLAAAYRVLGALAWVRGDATRAHGLWRRGLALAEALGSPYDLARLHLELGRRAGIRDHLQRSEAILGTMTAQVPKTLPAATSATLPESLGNAG